MKKWYLTLLIVVFASWDAVMASLNWTLFDQVVVNLLFAGVATYTDDWSKNGKALKRFLFVAALVVVRLGFLIETGKLYPFDGFGSAVPWVLLLAFPLAGELFGKSSRSRPEMEKELDESENFAWTLVPPPSLPDLAMLEKIHFQLHTGGVLYNIPPGLVVPLELKGNPIIWGDASRLRGRIHPELKGCVTQLSGNPQNIWGDASNIYGDISGLWGDVTNLYGCANGIVASAVDIWNFLACGEAADTLADNIPPVNAATKPVGKQVPPNQGFSVH